MHDPTGQRMPTSELLQSTRRAHVFAQRAFSKAARKRLSRPFALLGRPFAERAHDVELHSLAPFAVLEHLRTSVERALDGEWFTHGAILYVGVASPETTEELFVADVLEPGRRSVLRFAARGGVSELLGAVSTTDWP
jgi:hypothetical protein